MENLFAFIRVVREAQSIAQKDLGESVGISQSAITQFENGKMSLSVETLLNMASHLNLNPTFVEHGLGNPFKRASKETVIQMVMPETRSRDIDPYLLDIILKANKDAAFVLLTAPLSALRTRLGKPGFFYALALRDDENNFFLFARKGKHKLFGSTAEWMELLKTKGSGEGRHFEVNVSKMSADLFRRLTTGAPVKAHALEGLFVSRREAERRDFLAVVLKLVWSDESMAGREDECDRLRSRLTSLGGQEVESLAESFIRKNTELFKERLG